MYDFMGYLTTREGDFVYGASHECATDLLNHFEAWCAQRGLTPAELEPEITTWNLGESMIDAFLEFYGTGRLPTRAPSSGEVGSSGPMYNRPVNATPKKRYKGGASELEVFGLAGLPGGSRDDPESPDSYVDYP